MNSKSSKNQELNLRHRGSGLLGGIREFSYYMWYVC